MSVRDIDQNRAVLAAACAQVGLNPAVAEPIRLGENALFRLPGHVVVRIARAGQLTAAVKEVEVARWLARHDVPAVRALDGIAQPLEIDGRAVTFWEELPAHHQGTPTQVADALRCLHTLPAPTEFTLEPLAPFVRLAERIDVASSLSPDDRAWLTNWLAQLRERYADLSDGLPQCVLHGDAWVGNVVSTQDGRVMLLDLERTAIGPPEWDLVSTAIKHTSFAWITEENYGAFCQRYGHDVTAWSGFELLRDIRELRMTCYLAQHAAEHPEAHEEAQRRVACLRGHYGPRPWHWTPAA